MSIILFCIMQPNQNHILILQKTLIVQLVDFTDFVLAIPQNTRDGGLFSSSVVSQVQGMQLKCSRSTS